jgi:hypothetical protein
MNRQSSNIRTGCGAVTGSVDASAERRVAGVCSAAIGKERALWFGLSIPDLGLSKWKRAS